MASKKLRAPSPHSPPSIPSSSSKDEEEDESSSFSDQEEQTRIPQSKLDSPIQDQQPEDEEEESSSSSDQEEQANIHQSKADLPIQDQQSEDDEDEDEESLSSSDYKEQTHIPQSKPDPPIQNQQSEDHLPAETTTSKKPTLKSEKKMAAPSKPPNPHNWNPKGKSPIVRFWSLEDEIAILKAMLHHQPPNNGGRIQLNAPWVKQMHNSIRKSLSVDADTAKLVEKMRRMRKKYICASKRGAKLKLTTDQDHIIYGLSDKIWGKEEEDEVTVGLTVNGNSSAATASKGKSSKRDFPFIRDALGGGNRITLEMLETADVNKAVALEKSFKKLKSVVINLLRKAYKLLR